MKQTLVQQIIHHKTGTHPSVGDCCEVEVDLAWGSEMTTKFAIDILKEEGCLQVPYVDNVLANAKNVMFPFDHLIPANEARSASLMVDLREFARAFGIRVFEVGYDGGIQHRLFEERGFLFPGQVGMGADSHSCTYGALCSLAAGVGSTDFASIMLTGKVWLQVPPSILVELSGKPGPHISGKDIVLYLIGMMGVDGATYKALEFSGDGLAHLGMASRFTIANMAVEGGAKFGLFPTDAVSSDYLFSKVLKDFPDEVRFHPEKERMPSFQVDSSADYFQRLSVKLDQLEPMVALPFLPENTLGLYSLLHVLRQPRKYEQTLLYDRVKSILPRVDGSGHIPIQQVFIGSCTNGRIEDLRVVAGILRGKRIPSSMRAVIIPASQQVFRQALREGLVETFLSAGCYIESSSCGPCIGIKSGVVGKNEIAVFTSNRNFYGRTGDRSGQVILASPAVAAATALSGYLAAPAERDAYYENDAEIETALEKLIEVRSTFEKKRARGGGTHIAMPCPSANKVESSAGARAWCFGDNVNTDVIMPSRFCNITNPQEYKKFILADSQHEDFLEHFTQAKFQIPHDVIVAGRNFGCGSSRESAPLGIKTAGVKFVVACDFARIFFRNALNIGLPVYEIGEDVYRIREGDRLDVDLKEKRIVNHSQNESYPAKGMTPFQEKLIRMGGLMAYSKQTTKGRETCKA
ncbi:MAG: hypothetical protein HYW48_06165 [Deltaproteobacteria bacterium]|nr:hypothetical protein [Deltaproteobacteria bacterium]